MTPIGENSTRIEFYFHHFIKILKISDVETTTQLVFTP